MASYTPNLNLYKKDPVADGQDFFNLQTMVNDNFDKLDQNAARFRLTFTTSTWTVNSGDTSGYPASITVQQATHGLHPITDCVQWRARSLVSGNYIPNTWAAMETICAYNAQTGVLTIKATGAYDGYILVTG